MGFFKLPSLRGQNEILNFLSFCVWPELYVNCSDKLCFRWLLCSIGGVMVSVVLSMRRPGFNTHSQTLIQKDFNVFIFKLFICFLYHAYIG